MNSVGPAIAQVAGDAGRARVGQVAMWIFLATEIAFFAGVMLAYALARAQWPEGFIAASRETSVWIGTLNTALLLTSSACVAAAAHATGGAGAAAGRIVPRLGHREQRRVLVLLAATAALGLLFLVLKGVEYRIDWTEHLIPGRDGFRLADEPGAALFFALYFVATGVHAAHMLAGVAVLIALAVAWRRAPEPRTGRGIVNAALYWHFVDAVWIFLWPLLYLAGRAG